MNPKTGLYRFSGFRLIPLLLLQGLIVFFGMPSKAASVVHNELRYTFLADGKYEIRCDLYGRFTSENLPKSIPLGFASREAKLNKSISLHPVQQPPYSPSDFYSDSQFQKVSYSGILLLPARCTDWLFRADLTSFRNIVDDDSLTTAAEASLDNLHHSRNSSVQLSQPFIGSLFINSKVTFNFGAQDPDGDSLVYSVVNANRIDPTEVSINRENGNLTLEQSGARSVNFFLVISEYRKGILAASTYRWESIQLYDSTLPLPTLSGIDGEPVYNIQVCPGSALCFDIFSSAEGSRDPVQMVWDESIPGASFIVTHTAEPSGHFCWTPTRKDARNQPYTFTVLVTSSGGTQKRTQSLSYSIYVNDLLVKTSTTPISCNNANDGSIQALVSGGQPPYDYSWNGTQTNESALYGLVGGFYSLTVTDESGCSFHESVFLEEPGALHLSMTATPSKVNENTGTAAVSVSGGTLPCLYNWSTGVENSCRISGLARGNYTVEVTDANGCRSSAPVYVPAEGFSAQADGK